jgi:hypothetical protein
MAFRAVRPAVSVRWGVFAPRLPESPSRLLHCGMLLCPPASGSAGAEVEPPVFVCAGIGVDALILGAAGAGADAAGVAGA